MGINTVDLKGEPFTIYVEEGQHIARGQLIAEVDLAMLAVNEKKTDMIVVFTNGEAIETVIVDTVTSVHGNEVIGKVEAK
ncbi:hypothetical protein SDC9_184466 [bioreactor metagenome]